MFSEFEAQMSSEARPFPCVFGVAGYRQDQLRYLFLDPFDVEVLGAQLAQFVAESRSHGPNTSLIVFTRPRPVQTLDAYRRKMWHTLDQLARLDKSSWPDSIPEQIDHPMWEFSFAGEPIFVVCSTPAHVMRQSRRSSAFMLTFQPRWVFEKILGTEKAAAAAFAEVRKRLIPYDGTSPSPLLGRYGAADGRDIPAIFPGGRQSNRVRMSVCQARADQGLSSQGQGASGMTQIITGTKDGILDRPGHPGVASGAGLRRVAARRRGQGASFPHPPGG